MVSIRHISYTLISDVQDCERKLIRGIATVFLVWIERSLKRVTEYRYYIVYSLQLTYMVLSDITKFLFSEPSGRPHALIQFCFAFSMLSLYIFFYVIVENSASGGWLLSLIVGYVLSGIAESLPKERRRIAGVLRIAALLILSTMMMVLAISLTHLV